MPRETITRITVGSVQELIKELIEVKTAALGILSLRFKNAGEKEQRIIAHTMDYIKKEIKEYKEYEIVISPKEPPAVQTFAPKEEVRGTEEVRE